MSQFSKPAIENSMTPERAPSRRTRRITSFVGVVSVTVLFVAGCQVAPHPSPAVDASVPSAEYALVIERVESRSTCGNALLGFDLLVDTARASTHEREPVFCAPWAAHPGHVDMWRMCRRFTRCSVVGDEISADHVEVVCGRDHITLRTRDGRTWIEGPFGEHTLAPLRVPRVRVTHRTRGANVDC